MKFLTQYFEQLLDEYYHQTMGAISLVVAGGFFLFFLAVFISSFYSGIQLPPHYNFSIVDYENFIGGIIIVPIFGAFLLASHIAGTNPSRTGFYLLIILTTLFACGFLTGALTSIFPYITTRILVAPLVIIEFFIIKALIGRAISNLTN